MVFKALFPLLLTLAVSVNAQGASRPLAEAKIDMAIAIAEEALDAEVLDVKRAVESAHVFMEGFEELALKYKNNPQRVAEAMIEALERFSEVSEKFPIEIQERHLRIFMNEYVRIPLPQGKSYDSSSYYDFGDSLKLKAQVIVPASVLPTLMMFPALFLVDSPQAPDIAFKIGLLLSGGVFFYDELAAIKNQITNAIYNAGKFSNSDPKARKYYERIRALREKVRYDYQNKKLNSLSDCTDFLKGHWSDEAS